MIWIIIGSILAMLLVLFFVVLYVIYRNVFYSPFQWQKDDLHLSKNINYQGTESQALSLIEGLLAIPYEDVEIKSFDGLKLHGYLYKTEESNEVAIMFHGYRGTPRRDFSGGAVELIKLKKNVLLVDERAHGLSEGHSITFGEREQRDVLAWIEFVKKYFGKSVKITLVGISMGGATVLMAADRVDPEIKIIADCPYSKPKDVIKTTMEKYRLSSNFFYPFVALASIIFSHTRLKSDALESVKNSTNKILIIHGSADTIVPYQMSERVFLKNRNHVQYELFEGAEHGLSYLKDTERYKRIISYFLSDTQ